MSTSEFDSYRPPEPPRRRGPGRRADSSEADRGPGEGGDNGSPQTPDSRAAPGVEDPGSDTYYGRPVVKAPPWDAPIGIYLFLGGLAGGSALLATGAHLSSRPRLRRNSRLTTLVALGGGTVALIEDLGRPERFLKMLRTIKPTSPMSLGTWLLSGFGTAAGVLGAVEVDRMTGGRVPLGPLRTMLHAAEGPATVGTAVLGGPLASYTGALFADTAVPTWAASRENLSYLFVASSCMSSGGVAMVTTPTAEAGPARVLGALGAVGDAVFSRRMKKPMHELESEPLETGKAGAMMTWAERLAIIGGVGAVLGGRCRVVAVAGGLALAGASALTRFGVLEAGLESVKDPRRVTVPQRARLEERQRRGETGDSITTGG